MGFDYFVCEECCEKWYSADYEDEYESIWEDICCKGWGYDGADDKTVCLLCHAKYLESKDEEEKLKKKQFFKKVNKLKKLYEDSKK